MKSRIRGFVSLFLAAIFMVAVFSGVMLYVSPKGRVANWTGWTLAGLQKEQWAAVHINACLLLLLAAVVHLVLNWNIFWRYIKTKAAGLNLKVEMGLAAILTVALVAGTVIELPPFTATASLGDRIKAYWEQRSAAAPAPHAESFTLAKFASSVGLTVEQVVEALEKEGVQVEDEAVTIGKLAEANGMAPSQVFSLVTKHHPEAAKAGRPGKGRGRGDG